MDQSNQEYHGSKFSNQCRDLMKLRRVILFRFSRNSALPFKYRTAVAEDSALYSETAELKQNLRSVLNVHVCRLM